MKRQLSSQILAVAFGIFSFAFIMPTSIAPGDAPVWKIDAAHSSINFSVRHFFTPVEGTFDKFEGTVKFDPAHLHASSINFTVDINSIDTKVAKRNTHLLSGDFFNAEKYPTMSFRSSSIMPDGDGYIAVGTMTIKGVEQNMKIPFQMLGSMDHPMMPGMTVAGMRAEFTLDRNQFGVGTGDWAATMVVGGEVNVVVNLEVNTKKA